MSHAFFNIASFVGSFHVVHRYIESMVQHLNCEMENTGTFVHSEIFHVGEGINVILRILIL